MKQDPSLDHAVAHDEIDQDNDHDAKTQESHEHGLLDFIRLIVATINGKKIGDNES